MCVSVKLWLQYMSRKWKLCVCVFVMLKIVQWDIFMVFLFFFPSFNDTNCLSQPRKICFNCSVSLVLLVFFKVETMLSLQRTAIRRGSQTSAYLFTLAISQRATESQWQMNLISLSLSLSLVLMSLYITKTHQPTTLKKQKKKQGLDNSLCTSSWNPDWLLYHI